MTEFNSQQPIVIAHRGASGYVPEHTLAAKAMAHAMGADFIEQDVVLSQDGVPVVLHDIHLDSTTDVRLRYPGRARTDGRYYAIDFTLSELRQLCVHERSTIDLSGVERAVFADRFPLSADINFHIPTLAEEIDLIAGLDQSRDRSTGLYIELKAPNWHLTEGADLPGTVLAVLQEKGYADRPQQVFLQCFDDATLRLLRHQWKTSLPLVQLIGENSWGEDTQADFDQMRTAAGLAEIASYADGIGPWLRHIYPGVNRGLSDLPDLARAQGLLLHPYTFRRDELPVGLASFGELLDIFVREARVDGLFTDFPDLVHQYLHAGDRST